MRLEAKTQLSESSATQLFDLAFGSATYGVSARFVIHGSS